MIPPIANRFVAGEDADGALERSRELNGRGVGAILNRLGEHYHDPAPARDDAAAYVQLLERIETAGVDACVSVKPSQIGLSVDESVFREHSARIADAAEATAGFMWLDMEDHTTTAATVDAYETLAAEHPGSIGVCLQANLERTRDDVERLAGVPGKVRLVKGAYDPPTDVSIRGRDHVDETYCDLLGTMFASYDGGIAVGTHDPVMIEHARELHAEHGTPFEVQMLMGVREDALSELAEAGIEAWQYVPYGGKWASYFSRRVTERTDNLLFALRAILGR